MKVLDVITLVILIGLLGFGIYLWQNLPVGAPVEFKQIAPNLTKMVIPTISNEETANEYPNGTQFYPSMRYGDRKVSYWIEANCTVQKIRDIEYALALISSKTILQFDKTNNNPEIRYLCSNIAPTSEEEGHFVAGEGGPSEIINTSVYAVILTGKVSLYRPEICDEPKISIHETLHALGFDHSNNPDSIMYPVTNCRQDIDQYIIDTINDLYKTDSAPDLAIEKISANATGKYLNFDITVANLGLQDTSSAVLTVFAGGGKVKDFDLKEIEIGTRKFLNIQNLRMPNMENITIVVQSLIPNKEISLDNNKVELTVA